MDTLYEVFELTVKVIVRRDRLDIVASDLDSVKKFKCKNIRKWGEYFVGSISIPKKFFYGVNSYITNLPENVEIQLESGGMHTKILIKDNLLDYFEIGGPIKVKLNISIDIVIRKSGGTLKIPIPPSNQHQRLLKIDCNYPFEILEKDENKFATIQLPKMGSKKHTKVIIETNLELRGFSAFDSCRSQGCILIKKNEMKLDLMDDWGIFNRVVNDISKTNDFMKAVEILFRFIEGNVRYRSNPERFGPFYALKLGIGACDEISDLVIRILNFAGYSARFVKGLYLENYDRIQGHAWVEVLTNIGWIPFDPTGKIFGVGVRWIKLAHEEGKKERLFSVSNNLTIKSVKYSLN